MTWPGGKQQSRVEKMRADAQHLPDPALLRKSAAMMQSTDRDPNTTLDTVAPTRDSLR